MKILFIAHSGEISGGANRKPFSIFWKAVKKMADLYVKSLDMINPFVVPGGDEL